MEGFGSANFSQGRFGIGVQQGFVKPASVADVQIANHVIWAGYPDYSINGSSTALIFGGLIQGAFIDIQSTSTIYANNILMRWAGNLDLGVGTSTMYSFGKIAWDSQLVSDATWTNQTVS